MSDELISGTLIVLAVLVFGALVLFRGAETESIAPEDSAPDDRLSQEAIDGAVLREMNQKFGHIYESIGNPPEVLDLAARDLTSILAYADALPDRRWRTAYHKWIDYFEGKISRARKQWAHFRAVDEARRTMPRADDS